MTELIFLFFLVKEMEPISLTSSLSLCANVAGSSMTTDLSCHKMLSRPRDELILLNYSELKGGLV